MPFSCPTDSRNHAPRTPQHLACLVLAWMLTVAGCVAPKVSATKDPDRAITESPSKPKLSLKQDPVYVVQPGDTLAKIALWTTGDSGNWRTIARHNGIADPTRLQVGQRLRIPAALLEDSLRTAPPTLARRDGAKARPLAAPDRATPGPAPTPEPQATNPPARKAQAPEPGRAVRDTPAPAVSEPQSPPSPPPSQDHAVVAAAPQAQGQAPSAAPNTGWIVVTGSYYPREVKAEPDRAANSLLLVWPGTRLRYVGRQGIWYRVVTEKGEGYLDREYAREP